MALVWIVYVPDAKRRGPDLNRMNRVEDIPDELARVMVNDGSARWPTADELAAYRTAQQVEKVSEPKADAEASKTAKTARQHVEKSTGE